MLIEEMPVPRGEAVLPGAVRKFCSTAELFGWWLQPETARPGAPVCPRHEPGRLAAPDDARLIDATRAYYVVGIQRPGGMGATLASFADEEAATRLAAEEGGRVLRFDEIDQAVLQGVGGDHRTGTRRTEGERKPCRGYGRGFRLARRGAAEAYSRRRRARSGSRPARPCAARSSGRSCRARRWSLPACSGCRRSSHGRPADSSAAGRCPRTACRCASGRSGGPGCGTARGSPAGSRSAFFHLVAEVLVFR